MLIFGTTHSTHAAYGTVTLREFVVACQRTVHTPTVHRQATTNSRRE